MSSARYEGRSAQRSTTSSTVWIFAVAAVVRVRSGISAPAASRSPVLHEPRVYLYCSTVPAARLTVAVQRLPVSGVRRTALAVQFCALVARYIVEPGGVFTGTRTSNVTATDAFAAPANGRDEMAASNASPVEGSVRNSTYAPRGTAVTAAADPTSLRATPSVPTRYPACRMTARVSTSAYSASTSFALPVASSDTLTGSPALSLPIDA